ncbi:MAG: hypothetical protein U0457_00320 [Candidatus Sericytochromatia bacterium]
MDLNKKDIAIINAPNKREDYSDAITVKKFIIYYITSLGIYGLIWTYRAWKMIEKEQNLNIWPLARTIFCIFFQYSLYKRLLELAKIKGYQKNYSPVLLFISFYLLNAIIRKAPEPYDSIWVLGFITFISPIKAQLYYYEKEYPELKTNTKFSILSLFLVVMGFFIVLLTFIPDFSTQDSDKNTETEVTETMSDD